MLSALAHGANDLARVRVAVASLAEFGDDGRARAYFDFARKYYDAGREEGEVAHARTALLAVLAGRDMALSEELGARIDACADLATLDTWLVRAVRVATVAEIFAD